MEQVSSFFVIAVVNAVGARADARVWNAMRKAARSAEVARARAKERELRALAAAKDEAQQKIGGRKNKRD